MAESTTEITSKQELKNIIIKGDDGKMTLHTAFIDLQFLYDADMEDDVKAEIEDSLKAQLKGYTLTFGKYEGYSVSDVFFKDFEWFVDTIVN